MRTAHARVWQIRQGICGRVAAGLGDPLLPRPVTLYIGQDLRAGPASRCRTHPEGRVGRAAPAIGARRCLTNAHVWRTASIATAAFLPENPQVEALVQSPMPA